MTSKPVYSFGEDSPLKFEISDKTAKLYNQAAAEFFKAQQRFNQKFGKKWVGDEPLKLNWTKGQRKAWNEFAKIFNKTVEREGPYHANDIMEDFLVKNAVSVAATASGKFGKVISLAVAGGVLYSLLNRRNTPSTG